LNVEAAAISLAIYIVALIISIYFVLKRISEYGGLRVLIRRLLTVESKRVKKFIVDYLLQGRFFRWGGEPIVEGIFRGIAIYSYLLIMVLALLYEVLSLVGSVTPYANVMLQIILYIGLVALVSGIVILIEMRPKKRGRSWLLEMGLRDLLYISLIPILGVMAILSYIYNYFIYITLPFSSAILLLTSFTRFWYNISSALNILLGVERHPGKLTTPFKLSELSESDIENIRIGIGSFKDLDIPSLINLDSCANCGLCDSVCPAYAVGRPLSPRQVVLTLRKGARQYSDKQVVDLLSDDVFWACTTCGACVEVCPMGVDHVPFIIDVRRWLVYNSRLDSKKMALISNIAQSGNSIGLPNYGRHEWIRKLGIPTVGDIKDYDYLLWVGCMGSFDERAKNVIRSFIEILKEAGVKIAVLGDRELCCGDPLRRIGEESRFQDMAMKNIQLLKSLGVKRIVTICPHGYNTFKNEYRDIDPSFDIEVLHHTQLLAKLVEEGRIKPRMRIEEPVTLHDSCYIARINRITDEPRRIIRISSREYREARKSGFRTFCCGAGGANYWYDVPERKRISVERVEELVSTGSKVIVAECPFCIAMLEDALRNLGLDKSIRVRDLSEVLRGGQS
jgi:Fe-S oxidoreductase